MKKSELKREKAKRNDAEEDQQSDNGSEKSNQVKQDEDIVKSEVKNQNIDGPKRWYEDSDMEYDEKNKWVYLEHHGVTFPEPYIPTDLCVKYDGERVKLTPLEQQLGYYWSQVIGSDKENNQIFRTNFANQFMERFKKQMPKYSNFDKFDFSGIKLFQQKSREDRKNITDVEKQINKKNKEQLNKKYGYAIVDDLIEKISAYTIEPPTLFRGRGQHPKAGLLKPRIQPQDITINLAMNAPIPKCPLPGHSWGEIVSKKDSTWLCSYVNDAINDSNKHKYIFLAANSKFKGQSDLRKYEKARKLKGCIQMIRNDYQKKMEQKDMKGKQLGTATYLIDTLALRVGNQKSEEEADTVGCCSLRKQHIEILPDDFIKLSFLGKDSIAYENTVKVSHLVWQNLSFFTKLKEDNQDIFDKIDAQSLNDYLKSLMEGLTAKVFRTYNASITLQNQLKKQVLNGLKMTMEEKVQRYEAANKQVAILCNHQKTPSKKLVEGLLKKQQLIVYQKEYLKELEKHKNQFTKKDRIEREPVTIQIEGTKGFTKKYPQTKQATVALMKKIADRIQREEKNLKKKDQGKLIALGTSKTNYNDPRISIAWCKKNQVKIQKIFTKNLLSKFLWAMGTEGTWQF